MKWERCGESGRLVGLAWGPSEDYPGAAICPECTYGVVACSRSAQGSPRMGWIGKLRVHYVRWQKDEYGREEPVEMRYAS